MILRFHSGSVRSIIKEETTMKKLFALILTIALALTASSALAAGLEGKTIGFINAGPDD